MGRAERLKRLERARLYFVCDGRPQGRKPEELLAAALRGGTDIVQLREKGATSDADLVAMARPFRRAADAHGALFVLNDRPELVRGCAADGVHVGQEDLPVDDARAMAGGEAIVGLSTHTPEQIDAASTAAGDARPDQISVGPVWETPTKPGRPAAGLELVRYAAANATLPWFAIGGIDAANIGDVVAAGARRVVVVRAIQDALDPAQAARELRQALPRTVSA